MTQTAKVKVPVFSHEVDVVGLGFRMKRPFRQTLAKALLTRGGLKISLQREPMNKYDENAIRVDAAQVKGGVEKGQHLGYIRADTAKLIAPLMDCRQDGGFVFKAGVLNELYGDDDNRTGSMAIEFFDYRAVVPTL